jgi:hypothetical protein
MARLNKHGRELLRVSREKDYNPDDRIILKDGTDLGLRNTTWECVTRAYMADGTILQKHDVRFKPTAYDGGRSFYSYGWKIYGKLKAGIDPQAHATKTAQLIQDGKSKIVSGGPAPVILDMERITRAIESADNLGFCKACGAKAYGVEPDARGYVCESCGAHEVYGAEECLMGL